MLRATLPSWWGRLLYLVPRASLVSSPSDAAAGVLRIALDPDLRSVSGRYYELGVERRPSARALDDGSAARLWDARQDLLGLGPT